MANDQIEAIERDISKARTSVEFGNKLQRLRNNKDFKEVILNGYFEQEAVRLVHLKAVPYMQSPESQASIVKQMDAIGAFSGYMDAALSKAVMAAGAIEDGEAALVEITAEKGID